MAGLPFLVLALALDLLCFTYGSLAVLFSLAFSVFLRVSSSDEALCWTSPSRGFLATVLVTRHPLCVLWQCFRHQASWLLRYFCS